MASSGPNTAGTAVNLTGTGTGAWENPGNAVSSNNSYATLSLGLSFDSNYLKTTNCGFSIPSGATIDGIIVEYERKCSHNTASFYTLDLIVSLVKGGTIVGDNKADLVTKWSTTEGFFSYGSSSDLWGTTWTHTDINDSAFGAVLSAHKHRGGKISTTSSVDSVRITVHYTPSGGGTATAALLLAGN